MHRDDKIKFIESYVIGSVFQWAVRTGTHAYNPQTDERPKIDVNALLTHAHGLLPGLIKAVVHGKTTYGAVGDLQLQIESELKKVIGPEKPDYQNVWSGHLTKAELLLMRAMVQDCDIGQGMPLDVCLDPDSGNLRVFVPAYGTDACDVLEDQGMVRLAKVLRHVQEFFPDAHYIHFSHSVEDKLGF